MIKVSKGTNQAAMLVNCVKIWKIMKIKLIKQYKKDKNRKINKKMKKCVDKLTETGYNKVTKTNSHR